MLSNQCLRVSLLVSDSLYKATKAYSESSANRSSIQSTKLQIYLKLKEGFIPWKPLSGSTHIRFKFTYLGCVKYVNF